MNDDEILPPAEGVPENEGTPGEAGSRGAGGTEGGGTGGTGGSGGAGGTGKTGPPGADSAVPGPRGPRGRLQPWQTIWSFVAVVVLATAMTAFSLGAYLEAGEASSDLRQFATTNCEEAEIAKQNRRNDAWSSFNALNYNLYLLGIEKTPEVVGLAKRRRNQAIARNKPAPCPRDYVSIEPTPIEKPPPIP